MVPRADVSGFPLRHGDHPVIGSLHCSAHLRGSLREPLRVRLAALALPLRPPRPGAKPTAPTPTWAPKTCSHRTERGSGIGPLLQPDRPLLLRHPEPAQLGLLSRRPQSRSAHAVDRPAAGYFPGCCRRPGPGRPGRCPRDTAGASSVGVDLALEAERSGAAALPAPGRFALGAGVVVRDACRYPRRSSGNAVSYPACRLSMGTFLLSRLRRPALSPRRAALAAKIISLMQGCDCFWTCPWTVAVGPYKPPGPNTRKPRAQHPGLSYVRG